MNGLEKLSRREFLQKTGVASGGLVFAMALGTPRASMGAGASSVAPKHSSGWWCLRPDCTISAYSSVALGATVIRVSLAKRERRWGISGSGRNSR